MLEYLTYNAYPAAWGDPRTLTDGDHDILSGLALRFRCAADDPRHTPLRDLWVRHNARTLDRPLVAVWAENFLEMPEIANLECDSAAGRQLEFQLRQLLWQYQNVPDDKPLEGFLSVPRIVRSTGWGLETATRHGAKEGDAWGFEPVLKGYEDVKKLRIPELSYDAEETDARAALWRALFGKILPVRVTGVSEVGFHLCMQYSLWRGLTALYEDFYDEPEMLGDVLDFLVEGELDLMEQREKLGLLDSCFEGTYQGTGGFQYWPEKPERPVLRGHIWGHAEAQELAQVSPKMHREWLFTREAKLLKGFARTEYGCCEPLNEKLQDALKMPGLVKLSASPWAKLPAFRDQVPDDVIISWKPNPAWLTQRFDEDFIRAQLDEGMRTLRGKRFEVVLGDLRSCGGHPENIARWVELVRRSMDACL